MQQRFDVVILGGGIVGCATAQAIRASTPKATIAIVEAMPRLASMQSSRNSGVVHCGIFYKPSSSYATLCVQGAKDLLARAERLGLPLRKCGKLVVATNSNRVGAHERLTALARQATSLGVPDLRVMSEQEVRELEPALSTAGAILAPTSASIDFPSVAASLVAEAMDVPWSRLQNERLLTTAGQDTPVNGVRVLRSFPVTRISTGVSTTTLHSDGQPPVTGHTVIECAGMNADRLARDLGGARTPGIIPVEGQWRVFQPSAAHLLSRHVYPLPDPNHPWLGVHFTARLNGDVWAGPNALVKPSRTTATFSLSDSLETVTTPGFASFLARYAPSGVREFGGAWSDAAYLRRINEFLPTMKRQDLRPEREYGIRALALDPSGELEGNFVLERPHSSRLLVRNAPSPAATSCLAIGKRIAEEFRK